jgi:hypothetical protein
VDSTVSNRALTEDIGREAEAVGSKRILGSPDLAESPRWILLPSLLQSRNKLRAKYLELLADCKRWRNQAAAVETKQTSWRHRALTVEASLPHEQTQRAALEKQLQELRGQSAAREAKLAALQARPTLMEGAEKQGR